MRGVRCYVMVVRPVVAPLAVALAALAALCTGGAPVAAGAEPPGGAAATTAVTETAPAAVSPADSAVTEWSGLAGRFTPPLPAPVTVLTPFRPPATRYGAGHRGVDLAAPVGAEVRAAADGVVVFAGLLVDRGVVSVQHLGGLRTTYEPVDAVVSAGDAVVRGDVLGSVAAGHAGCAPASCLHLGARLPDRVYLDPMALFAPWRVRLKPWAGLDG